VSDSPSGHLIRLARCPEPAYVLAMVTTRKLPPGFIVPAQPMERERPPTGPGWVHEIKHDGYRLLVRRERASVRLFTRKANTWTERGRQRGVDEIGVDWRRRNRCAITERPGRCRPAGPKVCLPTPAKEPVSP